MIVDIMRGCFYLMEKPHLQSKVKIGALALPAELISEMMEVRTRRFETVTGFEDLELD